MLKIPQGKTLFWKGHSSTAIRDLNVMRIFLMALATGLMTGFPAQALTNPQTYCELFSKDYADSKTIDVDQWQAGYRNAFNSCMMQYSTGDAEKVVADKVTKKVAAAPARDTSRRKRTPLLAPGSVAWNEYCASKYASFDKDTGTYKSYSGKYKPCLVPSG